MPLIVEGAFVPDPWSPDGATPPLGELVPWSDIDKGSPPSAANQAERGLVVEPDVDVAELAPWLERTALVVIRFPSAADGRGFSLARRLRQAGYGGELRASGPLIADQYAFALACGFDAVEVPEEIAARQPEANWTDARSAISQGYQTGYGEPSRVVLRARHAAEMERPDPATREASVTGAPSIDSTHWFAHW